MYNELKQDGLRLIAEFMEIYKAYLNWQFIWKIIDKIEGLGYNLDYYQEGGVYYFNIKDGAREMGSHSSKIRIEAAYLSICFFINSYNAEFYPDRRWAN